MDILEKSLDIGQKLIPPMEGDSEQIWRWRVAVAMTVGGLALGSSLHVAWACGALIWLGLPGFASAAEVRDLQVTQQAIYTEVLANSLRDSEERQCIALYNGNRDAARFLEDLIRDKLWKYQRASGQSYVRRSCDLVVDTSRVPASRQN